MPAPQKLHLTCNNASFQEFLDVRQPARCDDLDKRRPVPLCVGSHESDPDYVPQELTTKPLAS